MQRQYPWKEWTAGEDKLLSKLFPSNGATAIVGRFPGRSAPAIRSRANILGLHCKPEVFVKNGRRAKQRHGENRKRAGNPRYVTFPVPIALLKALNRHCGNKSRSQFLRRLLARELNFQLSEANRLKSKKRNT